MPFMIVYKFIGDDKSHTCYVTYQQYQNFKQIPMVRECKVLKRNQQDRDNYRVEMQNAIDMAMKNDLSHIRELSQIV